MTKRRVVPERTADDAKHFSREIRVWSIRVNKNQKGRTYTVRWVVADRSHRKTFATRALADGERSQLLSYAQRGMRFHIESGLPEPLYRAQRTCSWWQHACEYVDMKWPYLAPKSRRSTADSLATVTMAMLRPGRGRPEPELIRKALYSWAFVAPARAAGPPPQELAYAVKWLEKHTVDLADLVDEDGGAELVRAALDALATCQNGAPAAANTYARKRAVFANCLGYARELGRLPFDPTVGFRYAAPKKVETVDRRCVVNHSQAGALLGAVRRQGAIGRRLVAMFGVMYYSAARPAEALDLRRENLIRLPKQGWGEMLLESSSPRAGGAWTDDGTSRPSRGLKHRGNADTRRVPIPPPLVRLLRAHLALFGTAPDGRLFVGPQGGQLGESSYYPVWHTAREKALTSTQVTSLLARRPYDLRHAAVSTWLNAGVAPAQVAEWAGHTVDVLLRIYAKCIDGQQATALRHIEQALDEGQGSV